MPSIFASKLSGFSPTNMLLICEQKNLDIIINKLKYPYNFSPKIPTYILKMPTSKLSYSTTINICKKITQSKTACMMPMGTYTCMKQWVSMV